MNFYEGVTFIADFLFIVFFAMLLIGLFHYFVCYLSDDRKRNKEEELKQEQRADEIDAEIDFIAEKLGYVKKTNGTDMVLAEHEAFENAMRIAREGHDLSVLFEGIVSNLAEKDVEIKKQYEEFKASADYIPPEERLNRSRFNIDIQRPSLSEETSSENME